VGHHEARERKKPRAVAPVFLDSRVVVSKQRRDKAGKIEICRGRCGGIADREGALCMSIATVKTILINETRQLVRERRRRWTAMGERIVEVGHFSPQSLLHWSMLLAQEEQPVRKDFIREH